MDETEPLTDEQKARVRELLDRPIATLTVREVAFLVTVLDDHEDEALALAPEIAALL